MDTRVMGLLPNEPSGSGNGGWALLVFAIAVIAFAVFIYVNW